jgi:hypothetical protein
MIGIFTACTPTQKLDRMLGKNETIEAVQIQFREDLLTPEMVAEVERRLDNDTQYRVIPHSEATSRLFLKIDARRTIFHSRVSTRVRWH